MDLIEKLKEVANDANAKGIPIPLLRDKGQGSHTLSMFVATWVLAMVLLAGKAAKLLDGVDYNSVLMLLALMGSFYLGRGYQKNGAQVTLTESKPSDAK